jgi:hypothetical protein
MKVTAFDFWDTERELGVEIDMEEVGLKRLKKNEMFIIDDVTYIVTKVFKKKSMGKGKLIETRMVKYKVPNTVTTHVHKCPAKMVQMKNISVEERKKMVSKYGESTVNGWQLSGRVKLKIPLAHQCPGCKVVFFKDKAELPETVNVVSTKGKKKLKRRASK